MSARSVVVLAFLALVAGCGGPSASPAVYTMPMERAAAPAAAVLGNEAKPAGEAAAVAPPARKVIFKGTLDLIVDDVGETLGKLRTLVTQMGGYVSKSDISGSPGGRTGTLTARVPVRQFPAAVEQFATLGKLARSASDSQDVTEEFIDAEARLKNYKAEEVALNKLLESSGGRLDDIFKIREQILRNRSEVERIEGRLKYLGNQTELSTLTLTLREEKAPGPPPAPPGFGERVAQTFLRSVASLREFVEELTLFVVALAPWLPVLLLLGWLTLLVLRKLSAVTSRKRPVVVATRLPDTAINSPSSAVSQTTQAS